ncbi:MAG: PRC-barrel domain-containing protein [Nitrososphaeraceae archaeon]|nr:PRC-barrel domain-containing protein [Nitrososphaeraceae archaeon]
MEPSDTDIIGLETVTADNKNLGKVIAIDVKKKNLYFIVLKKGLLKDEEYHIPINSITNISVNESKITINLNENEVKHGYELLNESNPSSDLIKGKSNSSFSLPFEKDKIKYESFSHNLEEPKTEKSEEVVVDTYICEMCQDKFKDISQFELHRKNKHSGPVGI